MSFHLSGIQFIDQIISLRSLCYLGSLFVTIRAIQTCFPPLHQQFMMNPQLNSRSPIVEVVGQFLTVLCDHVSPVPSIVDSQQGVPLQGG